MVEEYGMGLLKIQFTPIVLLLNEGIFSRPEDTE